MAGGALKKQPKAKRRGPFPHFGEAWKRKQDIAASIEKDLGEFLHDENPLVRMLAQTLQGNLLALRLTTERLARDKRGSGQTSMQRIELHSPQVWRLLDRISALRAARLEADTKEIDIHEYLRKLDEKPKPGSTE